MADNEVGVIDLLEAQFGEQVAMDGDTYVFLRTKEPIEISIVNLAIEEKQKKDIENAKQDKKNELEKLCEQEIVSGFASSAIGSERWYKSEQTDQLNLIGAVSSGNDSFFKCGVKDNTGAIAWNWEMHTIAQLKSVLNDGGTVKIQLLQKLTELKNTVDQLLTIEQIKAVVW